MKYIKKISGLLLVLTLLLSSGCEDFLEREPQSITHPAVFWVNQSNAEQALAGAYGLFKEAITTQASFMFWGEFPGMTFLWHDDWIIKYILNNGDFVLPYRESTRDWKSLYRAANWAFTIEQYVEGMDDNLFSSPEEKDRIIGEAAFIRALSYFYLTRVWGEVPVVNLSIETSDQLVTEDGYIVELPRSDEKEVLDFALTAVNKAIGLLDYSEPGHSQWAITANKASAEALKAHITLWYASRDNDNQEMLQACIDATTSVITNSNAELIDYVAEGEDGLEAM